MFEDWRTEIRALIQVGPSGRTRYTLDLELQDAEIKIAHPIGELDFQGLAGVRPPLLTSAQHVGLEGRARRFAAHLDNQLYEQAVCDEFERLWLSCHSTLDGSGQAKQLALNFWLAAHGLGPFMPHPIYDHSPAV
jgi:hypothetical protein